MKRQALIARVCLDGRGWSDDELFLLGLSRRDIEAHPHTPRVRPPAQEFTVRIARAAVDRDGKAVRP